MKFNLRLDTEKNNLHRHKQLIFKKNDIYVHCTTLTKTFFAKKKKTSYYTVSNLLHYM